MRKNCKPIILICALGLMVAGTVLADETIEVWSRLYRTSTSLSEEFTIMQNVVQLNDHASVPLMVEALQKLLIDESTIKGATDRDTYRQYLTLLLDALGSFKATEAAPFAYQVVQTGDDPLVKAEALIALGKMRATDYVEPIVVLLNGLNLGPGASPENNEKLAYGCIIALAKMRDIRGYAPVFYSSVGWYSKRIKALAETSLADLADDPTDALISVIHSDNFSLRIRALAFEAKSKAAADRKATVALAALGEGHRTQSNDVQQNGLLSQLRTDAMTLLVQTGSKDPDAVDLLKRSAEQGLDINEKVIAVYALGTNGTDPATKALSTLLMALNDQERVGKVSGDNDRLAMATVKALGATKNKIGRPALLGV